MLKSICPLVKKMPQISKSARTPDVSVSELTVAQLGQLPSGTPAQQAARHRAWGEAFDLLLLREIPTDTTLVGPTTRVTEASLFQLLELYEERISDYEGLPAHVQSLIRHVRSGRWSVSARMMVDQLQSQFTLSPYHGVNVLFTVMDAAQNASLVVGHEEAADQAIVNLVDKLFLDNNHLDKAEMARVLTRVIVERPSLFCKVWATLDPYARPAVALAWVASGPIPELVTYWATSRLEKNIWATALGYGLFNDASPVVIAKAWAHVGDQKEAIEEVQNWLCERPLDPLEWDDEDLAKPPSPARLAVLAQQREALQHVIPEVFWEKVTSERAFFRESDLSALPPTPSARSRPRA